MGGMDFWEVGAPGVLQVARARATDSSSLENSCTQPGTLAPQPPSCSTKCTNSHLLVPFHTLPTTQDAGWNLVPA